MFEPLVDLNLHNIQDHYTDERQYQCGQVSLLDPLKDVDVRLEKTTTNDIPPFV